MRSCKRRFLSLSILLALGAAGFAAPFKAARPPQDQKDLWIVTATFREEITTTLRDDWTFTQKITPDRLVRADHVTVKKVMHQKRQTTSVASIVTIVENEG